MKPHYCPSVLLSQQKRCPRGAEPLNWFALSCSTEIGDIKVTPWMMQTPRLEWIPRMLDQIIFSKVILTSKVIPFRKKQWKGGEERKWVKTESWNGISKGFWREPFLCHSPPQLCPLYQCCSQHYFKSSPDVTLWYEGNLKRGWVSNRTWR